jgi:hypothetical protein
MIDCETEEAESCAFYWHHVAQIPIDHSHSHFPSKSIMDFPHRHGHAHRRDDDDDDRRAPAYGAPAPGYGAPAPAYGREDDPYGRHAPAPAYGAPAPAPAYGGDYGRHAPAPAPAPAYGGGRDDEYGRHAPAPAYGGGGGYGAPAPASYGGGGREDDYGRHAPAPAYGGGGGYGAPSHGNVVHVAHESGQDRPQYGGYGNEARPHHGSGGGAAAPAVPKQQTYRILCKAGEDSFSLAARGGKVCLVRTDQDDDAQVQIQIESVAAPFGSRCRSVGAYSSSSMASSYFSLGILEFGVCANSFCSLLGILSISLLVFA